MILRVVCILLSVLHGAGCAESPGTAVVAGGHTATAQGKGISIIVSTDEGAMRTTDQLVVTVEVSRQSDATGSLVDPDFAEDGWALLDSHFEPERYNGLEYVSRWVFTIEPFLDGSYRVPPIAVKTADGVISTEALAIEVGSVLAENDDDQLAIAQGMLPPGDAPRRAVLGLVLAVGAGLGLVLAAGILWWVGRGREVFSPTPIEQLRTIAAGNGGNTSEQFARVHRAVEAIGGEELRSVRTACEQIRYSEDAGVEGVSAQSLAARAISLLGRPA